MSEKRIKILGQKKKTRNKRNKQSSTEKKAKKAALRTTPGKKLENIECYGKNVNIS